MAAKRKNQIAKQMIVVLVIDNHRTAVIVVNMTAIEIISKANRVEDQVLIGLGRTSRSAAVIVRLIDAAKASAVGDDEKAILEGLSEFGNKFMQIVGSR